MLTFGYRLLLTCYLVNTLVVLGVTSTGSGRGPNYSPYKNSPYAPRNASTSNSTDSQLEQAKSLTCGLKGLSRPTLIAGGHNTEVGEYPWSAGIYIKKGESYNQLCGATLVTTKIVIAAAHCFWNGQTSSVNNHTKYKVSVGRIQRSWDTIEPGEQKLDVEEIVINRRYGQNVATQLHDIAIVLLATPVTLSKTVNVVCVDWDNEFETEQLAEGQHGIATGWGLRENGLHSEILQAVSLPWVSEDTCWSSIPDETRKLYTIDKFCAGYVGEGISVCPADSGGGLVFQNLTTGKHYLRGVISVSFAPATHSKLLDGCYAQHYTGFTKLSFYMDKLKGYRNS